MTLSAAFLLLALLGHAFAQNPNCDFFQQVTPGQKYYIYNPGYPNNYSGAQQCRWTAACPSGYNCKIVCSEINLPQTQGCSQDRLLVSKTGDPQLSGAEYYCGYGSLTATSQMQTMTLGLLAQSNTPGGRFICELTAVRAAGGGGGGGGGGGAGSCRCGWKRSNRIVGGQETGVNEFPMMAGLVDQNEGRIKCGATIIAQYYVLTAAHCLTTLTVPSTLVLVGEHDVTAGESPATQGIRASRFIIHPNYNPSNYDCDIGLVKTTQPIQFSDLVGPACLPYRYANTDLTGRYVTALGWGTEFVGGPTSDVLMKVDLEMISPQQCRQNVPNVTPRQVCTYTPGKDACQDDSGGPMLYQEPSNGLLYAYGITSFGTFCANRNSPGVNTKASQFMSWIEANTPDASYCRK